MRKKRLLALVLGVTVACSNIAYAAPVGIDTTTGTSLQEELDETISDGNYGTIDIVMPKSITKTEPEAVGVDIVSETDNSLSVELSTSDAASLQSYRSPYAVTSVKNQNPYGLCWAYAAAGATETSAIKNDIAGNSIDISEYFLAYNMYNAFSDPLGNISKDRTSLVTGNDFLNVGGNSVLTTFQLSSWQGQAKEEIAPITRNGNSVTLPSSMPEDVLGNVSYHLQEASFIEYDPDLVKEMIVKYGAAVMDYYQIPSNEGSYTNTDGLYTNYYNPNPIFGTNHQVLVVGWDDSYSRQKFLNTPEGDGAWLIKNSWGTSIDNNGYFWLSYYDQTFSYDNMPFVVGYDFEKADNYDYNYQYDGTVSVSTMTANRFTNIFTVNPVGTKKEVLEAVGVALASYGTPLVVDIFKYDSDGEEDIIASVPFLNECMGYFTIKLPSEKQVVLSPGEKFGVKVRAEDSSKKIQLFTSTSQTISQVIKCVDYNEEGQSFAAAVSSQDLSATIHGSARIKAFTSESNIAVATEVSFVNETESIPVGGTKKLSVSVKPNGVTESLVYSSNNPSCVSVDENGNITGASFGKAIITVTTSDGRLSDTIEVTVVPEIDSMSVDYVDENNTYFAEINKNVTFNLSVTPNNADTSGLVWHSSNEEILKTVDAKAGTFVPLKEGQVGLRVTDTITGTSVSVTVDCIYPYKALSFKQKEGYSNIVYTNVSPQACPYTVSFTGGVTHKGLTYSSSDQSVIYFDPDGALVPVKNGTATITATTGYGSVDSAYYNEHGYLTATYDIEVRTKVSSIRFTKDAYSMNKGATLSLTPTIYPKEASSKEVTWESDNSDVATVSATGVVTAVGNGVAKITCTAKDGLETAKNSVSISVSTQNDGIMLDETFPNDELSLITNEETAKTHTLKIKYLPEGSSGSCTFKSNNTSVATVTDAGVVTAVANGKTTIVVTPEQGESISVPVKVTTKVTQLAITQNPPVLYSNDDTANTTTLSVVSVIPENASDKSVVWQSSNVSVAKVDENGKVTAVGKGTCNITAIPKYGVSNVSAKTTITVSNVAEGITLENVSVTEGLTFVQNDTSKNSFEIQYSVQPEGASSSGVTFSSSNAQVASVDANGKITAIGNGACNISVSVKVGTKQHITTFPVYVSTKVEKVESASKTSTYKLVLDGSSNNNQVHPEINIIPANASNKSIKWESSNIKVAKVDDTGLITAMGTGTCTVYAIPSDGGKELACAFSINVVESSAEENAFVFDMTETELKFILNDGFEKEKTLTTIPSTATLENVEWKTTNEKVAVVDENGKVTAVGNGMCSISVSADGMSEISIPVTVITLAESIKFTNGINSISLTKGVAGKSSYQLNTMISPASASEKNIVWKSSNIDVAAVSGTGLVSAAGEGTCFITASVGNVSATIPVTVTQAAEKFDCKSTLSVKEGDVLSVDEDFGITPTGTVVNVTIISGEDNIRYNKQTRLITCLQYGKTTIRLYNTQDKTQYKDVTLMIGGKADGVTEEITIRTDMLYQFEVPDKTKSYIYVSSNESIASVNNAGVITPQAEGVVTITATQADDETNVYSLIFRVVDPSNAACEDTDENELPVIPTDTDDKEDDGTDDSDASGKDNAATNPELPEIITNPIPSKPELPDRTQTEEEKDYKAPGEYKYPSRPLPSSDATNVHSKLEQETLKNQPNGDRTTVKTQQTTVKIGDNVVVDDYDETERLETQKYAILNAAYADKKYGLSFVITASGEIANTVSVMGLLDTDKKNVTIPSFIKIGKVKYKVTSIADTAFKDSSVEKVSIPSAVTKIGIEAFANCKKLKTVTIGKNVKSIGKRAFYNDTKLKTLKIKSSKLNSDNVHKTAFQKVNKTVKIYCPKSKLDTYKKLLRKKGISKKATFKKL